MTRKAIAGDLSNCVTCCKRTPKMKKTANQPTTYVTFVIDESGSMLSLTSTLQKVFSEWINKIRAESTANHQKTVVSLLKFSSTNQFVFQQIDINGLPFNPLSNYCAHGLTALFDAEVKAIEEYDSIDKPKSKDAFLVFTLTDGEENDSSGRNITKAITLLKEKQKTDRWTFAFLVPPGYKNTLINRFHVPNDNVQEWSTTQEGLVRASTHTQDSISSYYTSRKAGKQSVTNFFVNVDLSKVKPTDIKKNLTDVSRKYKVYQVEKEIDIKTFVEFKTGKDYVPGTAFYELSKPEKVQSYKEVLVMEKNKKSIWGGSEARQLIGLPNGQDAKVKPLDLAKMKLFIKSTSTNRRLVRGTSLIVLKTGV